MVYDETDGLETPQEEPRGWKMGPAGVLGAFAAGILVGGALTVGLFIVSRTAMAQLEKGSTRPRRLLIGDLEIEERGDNSRIHKH